MKIITAEQFWKADKDRLTVIENEAALDQTVLEIIQQVRANGDQALKDYTEKFDRIKLESLIVTAEEFTEARSLVDADFLPALQQARQNITDFHLDQKENSWFINKQPGILLGQKLTPIDRAGVYIPGGKAAYPSTVLMNVIPAQIAGVENIVIATPTQSDGKINPYVLAAAEMLGIQTIYKVGGAQAIAALAYGTETVDKVDKIVGPGNTFVARAKKWVYGDVAIDMIAGPSEICVVADESAPPRFVAADLLSQAEHDESACAICVTTSKETAEKIKAEVENQTESLERKAIIQQSIEQNGKIIIADSLKAALDIVNEIAPEHLQLMIEDPTESLDQIKHAGAIFLGNYSPEPLGDYFAGPNHTLPTNGTARFASPLGVYDFVKKSSIIRYSKEALQNASESIITIANVERLTAHANAIAIRKDEPNA